MASFPWVQQYSANVGPVPTTKSGRSMRSLSASSSSRRDRSIGSPFPLPVLALHIVPECLERLVALTADSEAERAVERYRAAVPFAAPHDRLVRRRCLGDPAP